MIHFENNVHLHGELEFDDYDEGHSRYHVSASRALELLKEIGDTVLPDTLAGIMIYEINDQTLNSDWHVNVYIRDRGYGGPEEGGWFFDYGEPQKSHKIEFTDGADLLKQIDRMVGELEKLCDNENDQRRSDIGSVLSEGRYELMVEPHEARRWPRTKPHYE